MKATNREDGLSLRSWRNILLTWNPGSDPGTGRVMDPNPAWNWSMVLTWRQRQSIEAIASVKLKKKKLIMNKHNQVSLQSIEWLFRSCGLQNPPPTPSTRPSMKNLKTIVYNYNVFQVHYIVSTAHESVILISTKWFMHISHLISVNIFLENFDTFLLFDLLV
jgi:hypothetical protein